jgi:hypothetical protein
MADLSSRDVRGSGEVSVIILRWRRRFSLLHIVLRIALLVFSCLRPRGGAAVFSVELCPSVAT